MGLLSTLRGEEKVVKREETASNQPAIMYDPHLFCFCPSCGHKHFKKFKPSKQKNVPVQQPVPVVAPTTEPIKQEEVKENVRIPEPAQPAAI